MVQGGLAAGAVGGVLPAVVPRLDARSVANVRGVAILLPADPGVTSAPECRWALDRLRQALTARRVPVRTIHAPASLRPNELAVVVGRNPAGSGVPRRAEAVLAGAREAGGRRFFDATGSDDRGLVYALTDAADIVSSSPDPVAALIGTSRRVQVAANPVRSVMRVFCSDVEDKPWFNDRDFWRDYLSMLATERFNRFNLALGLGYDFARQLDDTYFYFAYPFLLDVPGYNVRATNLPNAERDQNLEMLRFISDESSARGLEFQLGLWTHAYIWQNSPRANHVIEGLSADQHATYCRDGLALLLKSCPNISGVTFRVHGESGVAEGSYDFWKTVFDGAVRSGRTIRLDLHAKGIDQSMIDTALATGLPVTVSPKFWAEHMGLPYHQAAIRPTEMPVAGRASTGLLALSSGSRSFTRYGYADLLAEDRRYDVMHRIWPGTQRVLLWGDPTFAAAYGRSMSFCGSVGCEIMEPLSFKGRKGSGLPGGREGYADVSLRAPGPDAAKFRYTYRLWGRMLHDPETPADVWQRQLREIYGTAAAPIEQALASASRILPLVTTAHLPSAANNNYWPEMYVNMSIVDITPNREPYNDTPTPRRFGTVSPLDPQLFSTIEAHADSLLDRQSSPKISPVEVADRLDALAAVAMARVAEAKRVAAAPMSPALKRTVVNVEVQAGLGRFFANKLRAGVLYALFDRTRARDVLERAIAFYEAARAAWAGVADVTTGVYVRDVTYGPGTFQRGHWADRLAAIDRDVAAMQTKLAGADAAAARADVIPLVLQAPARPVFAIAHTPPATFTHGGPVNLTLAPANGGARAHAARCLFRRVNQADAWMAADMAAQGGGWHVQLPGSLADSAFPIQYYFELTSESGAVSVYPGFDQTWSSQPYIVVRLGR